MNSFKEYVGRLAAYGDKPALTDHRSGQSRSFLELVAGIERRAAWLQAQGLVTGDRLLLIDVAGIDWVETFFAAIGQGIIIVTVDSRMSDEMLARAVELTAPKLVATAPAAAGAASTDNRRSHRRLVRSRRLRSAAQPFRLAAWPALPADQPAEIIFTSGTWAVPKGVTLSHGNLLANFQALSGVITSRSDDVLLSILPLSHAYEQMCGLLMPLAAGSHIVYLGPITAAALTDANRRYGVSVIVAVPRVLELLQTNIMSAVGSRWRRLFGRLAAAARRLPAGVRRRLFAAVHRRLGGRLRLLTVGGAPLSPATDHFFSGLGYQVAVGYGLSEASPVLAASVGGRTGSGDVGRPLSGLKLTVDKNSELYAEGPSIFLGYWPDLSSGGKLRTGDLAKLEADGRLRIIGRKKHLIVYPSGDKLLLDDVEVILNTIDGVSDSCAVDIGDDGAIEIGVAVAGGAGADAAAIKDRLKQLLPPFAYIRRVEVMRELPRTHTMKHDRRHIRELLRSGV